jgi:hypothetical protein
MLQQTFINVKNCTDIIPANTQFVMDVYEKYNDILSRSHLLFVHDATCIKSILRKEECRLGAPCFLYMALHM